MGVSLQALTCEETLGAESCWLPPGCRSLIQPEGSQLCAVNSPEHPADPRGDLTHQVFPQVGLPPEAAQLWESAALVLAAPAWPATAGRVLYRAAPASAAPPGALRARLSRAGGLRGGPGTAPRQPGMMLLLEKQCRVHTCAGSCVHVELYTGAHWSTWPVFLISAAVLCLTDAG